MPASLIPSPPSLKHIQDHAIRSRLIDLRERVAPILTNNLLPHFTDHSVAHSDSLARFVDDLVEPLQASDHKLSEDELFILYAACYLHDIGMQYEKAGETSVIRGLHLSQRWEELNEDTRRNLLRQNHAAISGEMVRKSLRAESPVIGVQLTPDYFPQYVASLCEAHTLPVESPRYKALTSGGPNIRMELLSGLLRIADILDLSRRRANRSKALTLNLELESQTHWWRHHYTEDITVDKTLKLVSVWFDFPKSHAAEYRKVVPQLQMPWIEAEFSRHAPVFHRNGFGWSVTSVISDRPFSDAEVMPDAVMAEMLKQLYRQLKRDEEEHRHMVVQLFDEAQPHIDRRLSELGAKKDTMSAGDYLKEVSKIAADLSELGGKRSARKLLMGAYDKGVGELETVDRLEIGRQLATMISEEGDAAWATRVMQTLVPLADELPDTNPSKLSFWKAWAKYLADGYAYDQSIEAFQRAIELSTNDKDRDDLRSQLAELHLLLGNLDKAISASSDNEGAR